MCISLVFRAFFRPSHHFLLSSAIAEYCAQNLFPQEYDSLPRKQDVVMPVPEICKDGVNLLQVGQFKFKLTHKLSQLGLTSTLHHSSSSKPQSSL